MPFVSSSIYKKALQLVISEGLSTELLGNHYPLKQTDAYVPMTSLLDVYELAEEHLLPNFGLRQGKQLNSNDYGTLGLSWKTCLQAIDVLRNVKRYMVLVTNDGSIDLSENTSTITLTLDRDVYRKGVKTTIEVPFVMLLEVINEVTGKKINPIEVCFKHDSSNLEDFIAYFGCHVKSNARVNSIKFDSKTLQIATLKADRFIHDFLTQRMEEEKKKLSQKEDELTEEINTILKESMASGIPSLTQIGDYLGISGRTLKRRLSDRNLTFRDLVQKNREQTAIELLSQTSQSIGEIAFLTGFSEQSAFNRAFKKWTGQTPNQYRKAN
ncbi:helix-turn-helix domain-containing protein [Aestuariibaculum sp. YM273]|uniref:AraC family transcriptional regulator n=1 Tax=Aestuariibaculum sp. YM273 TaxID=3070659 RepID=UPI0027DB5C87|nr:helix-turn-helix domain-containing protein [Aestuariibaculum sp. YM273]WMI64778.1 helix-turn-helix domain-containing protein [Aestuariibaculum sp. YM273]